MAPNPVGHEAAAPPLVVAQHFHNSALSRIHLQQQTQRNKQQQQLQQQFQQQQQAEQRQGQSHRKQPPTASGGATSRLPTLPEASHVNALHEATGASPVGLPAHLDAAIEEALAGLSAPQRALAHAKSAGYSLAVMELANDEFRQRWERLCLANTEEDDTGELSAQAAQNLALQSVWQQQQAAASSTMPQGWSPSLKNPGGVGGSWELLPVSGDPSSEGRVQGIPRSSSRGTLPPQRQLTMREAAQARAVFEAKKKRLEQAREAEEWRKNPAFRRTELNLTALDDSEGVIAMAPGWLELDSQDEGIRLDSEIALHALLTYASYLSISTFILPPPSSDPARRHLLPHYARAINSALNAGPGGQGAPSAGSWMALALRLPISSPHSLAQVLASRSASSMSTHSAGTTAAAGGSSSLRAADDWAFEVWTQIRHLCGYNSRLQIMLDLSMPLPSSDGLARWQAEPVRHLWLPASTFLANAKGFPVLSKAMQAFLRSLFTKHPKPMAILSGTQDTLPQHTRGGPSSYLEYLRHLERTAPSEGAVAIFARGYADWLQAPLQPLMDNLEGATYEVFERDPVKYALYQEAVYKALLARPAGERTLIWVCGAGRGPLVSRCLAAAADAGRDIKIVALEKNPSAVIALQEKQAKEWGADTVELRFGDMRTATRPAREEERADILVSELLGSFGDNELSPECLDGACRFIKKNGISIPSAYTSYITPLSSAKLHSEILSSGSSSAATSSGPSVSGNNPTASTQAQIKAAETPFVVLFGAVDLPASENGPAGREKIQECWTFAHGPIEDLEIPLDGTGLPISNSHNVRTTSHTFSIPNTTLCHGLAGYFEAHLYGDVSLSIHPDPSRGSTDMLSWFPIYFPLKEPLYLPAGSELDVHLWRLTAERKVWYEWSCEVFLNVVSPGGAVGGAANGRPSSAMTVMGGASSPDPSQWQQQQHGGGGGGGPGGASPLLGSHLNHPHQAFANAVNTPRIPSYGFPSDAQVQYNRRASGSTDSAMQPVNGRSVSSQGHYQPPGGAGAAAAGGGGGGGVGGYAVQRVKIGMSSLQNPNGRSSWVGM